MATKPSTRPHRIPIEQQVGMMRALFPDFVYDRKQGEWLGSLRPTDSSPAYRIRLRYRAGDTPKVHVLSPEIVSRAKHRYANKSLCLYHPDDGDWHAGRFLANTIMLWAAEWLLYYEAWLVTGEWFGPEAPHRGPK